MGPPRVFSGHSRKCYPRRVSARIQENATRGEFAAISWKGASFFDYEQRAELPPHFTNSGLAKWAPALIWRGRVARRDRGWGSRSEDFDYLAQLHCAGDGGLGLPRSRPYSKIQAAGPDDGCVVGRVWFTSPEGGIQDANGRGFRRDIRFSATQ